MDESSIHSPHSSDTNIIGQRLKFEMKKRGISSTELAKRADVKTSFLYDIISGKSTNPSTVKLARVADALGVSLPYLVGAGNAVSTSLATAEDYLLIPRLSIEMLGPNTRIVSLESEGESQLFRKSWIMQQLGVMPSQLRLYTMRGDSMEPNLQHNDTMLIDVAQVSPSTPGVFVLFDGVGLAVKRLEYIANHQSPRVKILSDNPQYSAYERALEETSIVGRVVWFSREI